MGLGKILETILILFYGLTNNYGVSIILLSLVVTIIMFPLFMLSERMQLKERRRKSIMQPALLKIKNIANRQEKFYYTKEIYKQHNYSPYYSLTGLLGLLIQIPFFLAAYWMLKDFVPLEGSVFLSIEDLSQPDRLISFTGITINALPFVMTIVNLFAGYLYAKNMDKNEQLQLIVISFIFLILLYKLSAALVLYWTMNNVFAIGKNWLLAKQNNALAGNSLNTKQSSLYKDFTNLLKSKNDSLVFVLLVWSIYYLILSVFYIKNIPRSPTSILSIVVSLLFLETIAILILFFKSGISRQIVKILFSVSVIINVAYFVVFYLMLQEKLYVISNLQALIAITITQLFFVVISITVTKRIFPTTRTSNEQKNKDRNVYVLSGILIIVSPLIQYVFYNPNYFTQVSLLIFFVILIGTPFLFISVVDYFSKSNFEKPFVFGIFIAIFLTLYTLPIITNAFSLIAENNVIVHFFTLAILTTVVLWVYHIPRLMLLIYSAVFFTGSIIQTLVNLNDESNNRNTTVQQQSASPLYNHLSSQRITKTPDIYYLLYDSYVNEKLMKMYEIDNSTQMNYLREHGFNIHENAYSLEGATLRSTSSMLELENVEWRQAANKILGNSAVDNILQENGYETHYVVGDYFVNKLSTDFGGDFLNNKKKEALIRETNIDGMISILYSIILGEFKFDNEFLLGTSEDDKLELKKAVIMKNTNSPKFMFYHTNYPGHGRGNCNVNEFELYENKVKLANEMMIDDVEQILSNDKDAIIIIAGDHGPHRKGECHERFKDYKENEISSEHIYDVFGSFLAIRYPEGVNNIDDILLIQNVFISIFSNIFNVDNLEEFKLPAETRKGIFPKGVINDGVITFGVDKGKKNYENIPSIFN